MAEKNNGEHGILKKYGKDKIWIACFSSLDLETHLQKECFSLEWFRAIGVEVVYQESQIFLMR